MIININVNVWAISGQGKSGFATQALLGQAIICGIVDTNGMTAKEVANACIDEAKMYLPDATYIVKLPP